VYFSFLRDTIPLYIALDYSTYFPIEAKVALASVTLSEAKSLVPRMTGSLFARNGILRTVLDGQYRVAPLLRMTDHSQLIGDVSLLP